MPEPADFQNAIGEALGKFMGVDALDRNRIARYRENWRYYYGRHWNVEKVPGESQITINYGQMVVDSLYYFMYGKNPRISRETREREGEKRDETRTILEFLYDVWNIHNEGDCVNLENAVMLGVTGDSYVSVSTQERDADGNELPDDEKRILLQLLDSELVLPRHKTNPFGELDSVDVFYPWIHWPRLLDGTLPNPPTFEVHVFKQTITDAEILEFVDNEPITKPTKKYGAYFEGNRANPLKRINVVHIRNKIMPREYFGQSDIANVTGLNTEVNSQISEIADILAYHASPVTIVKGARVSGLERGKNKVWGGLPADGDVKNLEMASDLQGSHAFYGELRSAVLEVSRVPEVATGRPLPVSNLSSSALAMLFGPILEVIARKKPGHRRGLRQINELIMRTAEAKFGLKISRKGLARYHTDVSFQLGFPRNKLEDLQTFQLESQLHVNSRERYWDESGVEDPEELAEQIEQEVTDQVLPPWPVEETQNLAGNTRPPPSGNDKAGPGRPANPAGDK